MAEEFRLKQFSLFQRQDVFRITTDSILLGAWASFENPGNLLDVGTGTGIVALMLAQKHPLAQVYGIDINPAAVRLSMENFSRSMWSDRLHAIEGDFTKYDFGGLRFDGIVTNPPFFLDSLRPGDQMKGIARHSVLLNYRDLACRSAELLTKEGAVFVIIPYNNLRLLEREFNFEYLFCQKRLYICSKGGQEPKRVIVKFVRMIEECGEEWLSIRDESGYSDGYRSLTRDFYINF